MQTVNPTPTIRIVRTITSFDKHLNEIQLAFVAARDKILHDIEQNADLVSNFVNIVVKSIQAVAALKIELVPTERTEMINDLVKEVINELAISDEQKYTLSKQAFPMISNLVQTLEAASEGYLYFAHKLEEVGKKAGCIKESKTKSVRRGPHRKSIRDPAPSDSGSVNLFPGAVMTIKPDIDVDALVSDIYNTLQTVVHVKQIGLANIVSIGSTVMQIIEQYPQLAGAQKKDVAIRVLHKLVEGLDTKESTKTTLICAIDTILPYAIDFIVAASRGEIQLVNIITDEIKGCVAKCKK